MLQPTIRSTLASDTATDYLLCSTISVDSTSDNPIYRLSMLQPTIRSTLSSVTATDYPLYSTLLCLLILQPTIRTTLSCDKPTIRSALSSDTANDYPRCSTLSVDSTSNYTIYRLLALPYLAILQTIICCAPLCLATLQPTIRSALLWRVSLQLAMRSTLAVLPVDSKTDNTLSSTRRYYNRLSALLHLASLATLLLTIRSPLPADILRCSTLSGDDTSYYLLYFTLSVGMLGGGLVWWLVGVPFRRLVGVLVVGLVGVLSSNLD
jgi:hypothetical protein